MTFEKPKYVEYKNHADIKSHFIAKAKHDTIPDDKTWPEVDPKEYNNLMGFGWVCCFATLQSV